MTQRRMLQRGKKIRGTCAYDIAEYLSRHKMLIENDLSLHPALSRFYGDTYTKADLVRLISLVREMKLIEQKTIEVLGKLDAAESALCNGK